MGPTPRLMGRLRGLSRRRMRGRRTLKLLLVTLPIAGFVAYSVPVAQAQPATPQANASLLNLPLSVPSPCLLNAVLCGQNLVQDPAPCLLGSILCKPVPLPSPCVGGNVLCDGGGVLTNGALPPLPPPLSSGGGTNPPPGPSAGSGRSPANAAGAGSDAGAAAAAPLVVPPGVGLVPGVNALGATGAPNPDPLAVLLSLSIRDGLSASSESIWPVLAGIQVLLLLGIVAVMCSRQLTAASVESGR